MATLLQPSLLRAFVLSLTYASVDAHIYQTPVADADWKLSSSGGRCELAHEVHQFGTVSLIAERFGSLYFRVRANQPFQAEYSVGKIASISTEWNGQTEGGKAYSLYLDDTRRYIDVPGEASQWMLSQLRQGMQPVLGWQSEADGTAQAASILPVGFTHAYAELQTCLGKVKGDVSVAEAGFHAVHFAPGSAQIDVDGRLQLEELADFLKLNDRIPGVQLDGNSDETGRDELNRPLSQRRVQAVAEYLAGQGIPASKLRMAWHGSEKPRADNALSAGRSENRRVDISFLYGDLPPVPPPLPDPPLPPPEPAPVAETVEAPVPEQPMVTPAIEEPKKGASASPKSKAKKNG